MFGGVQAVAWTDVKQMALIVGGLIAVVVALVVGLPDDVGLGDALSLAGTAGRLQTFDFSFDLTNRYTFWSGTIAAFFLFCSYFGTDQSQVQRYLTAKSVDEARTSLLMSAYWKIPAAGAGAARRRADVRVLPVHAAAVALQRRARTPGAGQRPGRRLRRRRDTLPHGFRAAARGGREPGARAPGWRRRSLDLGRRSWRPPPTSSRPEPTLSPSSRRCRAIAPTATSTTCSRASC